MDKQPEEEEEEDEEVEEKDNDDNNKDKVIERKLRNTWNETKTYKVTDKQIV